MAGFVGSNDFGFKSVEDALCVFTNKEYLNIYLKRTFIRVGVIRVK